MQLSRAADGADDAGIPDGLPRDLEEPAALAAALGRALAGRQALARQVVVDPNDPALREALELAIAHCRSLLRRLAALAPPERHTRAA